MVEHRCPEPASPALGTIEGHTEAESDKAGPRASSRLWTGHDVVQVTLAVGQGDFQAPPPFSSTLPCEGRQEAWAGQGRLQSGGHSLVEGAQTPQASWGPRRKRPCRAPGGGCSMASSVLMRPSTPDCPSTVPLEPVLDRVGRTFPCGHPGRLWWPVASVVSVCQVGVSAILWTL